MAAKPADLTADQFAKFIRTKRILIADPNSSSRAVISSALVSLGAIQNNIDLTIDYDAAEQELKAKRHQVVICDFHLGKRCGLDLLQAQREYDPELKQSLFILVTGNTSQSAIAQAAEEDIDGYILKPFSIAGLEKRILQAAGEKLFPNPYRAKILEGKDLLAAGKINEASTCFQQAMLLDPTPTLACFYHGQANLMKQMLDQAETDYNKGLSYNRIHYKCMVGLYELMIRKNMHTEAYDIVRKIALYFPANPKRLASVVRLAIMTQNYEDLEGYYQTFTNLDERNEELIRYVCAGLVICGKFYLQRKITSRAVELFNKAAVTGFRQIKILREVVVSLIEYDLYDYAEKFLKRFPPEAQHGNDYRMLELLTTAPKLDSSAIVDSARQLIQKGVQDPQIYKLLIANCVKSGMSTAADRHLEEALSRWPEQEKEFRQARENHPILPQTD